jgi:hypothetical protein
MAEDARTRKLATIVALDVAGYSVRAEADEAPTTTEVRRLTSRTERQGRAPEAVAARLEVKTPWF